MHSVRTSLSLLGSWWSMLRSPTRRRSTSQILTLNKKQSRWPHVFKDTKTNTRVPSIYLAATMFGIEFRGLKTLLATCHSVLYQTLLWDDFPRVLHYTSVNQTVFYFFDVQRPVWINVIIHQCPFSENWVYRERETCCGCFLKEFLRRNETFMKFEIGAVPRFRDLVVILTGSAIRLKVMC